MKIPFATNDFLEVPFTSLAAVSLDGLNLHRVILEGMDMSNSSLISCNLRGAV
ncbi:pentapeptide repeat-containing protein [Flavitalea sp. BT771]|uniref:pentapeptide repeat-containing protein n=1 Tax=Flavitalea sp. BT771 TaxID=3063329 RepID=UPI0026E2242B|nr:pentapeptide repeat-containing protein [Flavitalea sp. BT771]MDO6433261.1 pentapeptide repeat-containing protein [Flavitalea sp. BT771]